MEDDSIIFYELSLLASIIKKEVINVLDFFLSFLKKYENKKTHNMISLMLDPRFNSLCIVSSFVGREQGVALIKEYDKKSLNLMLVKCHEHVNLKGMKLLNCKISINKILFSVKKLFPTMFVVFSLIRKIIKLRFYKKQFWKFIQ